MSRRKQARPSRAHLEEDLAQGPLLINAVGNVADESREENDFASDGEECGGVSGGAVDEAVDLTASRSHHDEDEKDQDDPLDEEDEECAEEQDEQDEDEEGSRKQMRHRQDAENNNNFPETGPPTGLFPPAGTSHVTLEALQNTKVAVAQFAATALAGGADSEAALQDLALLQSTLYTLQHQQVFQLQLISQLRQQLSISHGQSGQQPQSTESDGKEACSPPPGSIHPKSLSSLTSPPSSRPPSHHQQTSPTPMTTTLAASLPQERPPPISSASPLDLPMSLSSVTTTSTTNNSSVSGTGVGGSGGGSQQVLLSHQMPPLCSISSSLASSIITNTDPPPLHEPNTLEMLQKRAQEVLDNASQGLLANNLADELAFRSGGGKGSRMSPYDSKTGAGGRGEPFFKHRCRYCGKVFGSDSALQIHIRSHTVRGNTTCNICYKTFACNSALEIHYRSHTKERPFKCTICDRGFSTKGNMKQHMLTHKIRDMPSHLFSDPKQHQQIQDHETSRSPMCADDSSLPPPPPPPPPPLTLPPSSMESAMSIKRSPTEGDLPAPKRPTSMPSKHLCQICNKNFSSSSALQIHMRTHTGDKPFRCTVCQKAFTTKGNLKVHMGTHMWTNGASRRGRRMSLDLPPLPITPKDSEFLQRRPDLFYPYLPSPFLNGVQQKLNEISVIQGNNGLPSHSVSAGKYAGLFGSVYSGAAAGFPLEKQPMAPTSNGPLMDGKSTIPTGSMLFQTPSPSHSPGTPSSNSGNQNSASVPSWTGDALQHHFEREVPTRSESNATPPSARLPPPPAPRGEGLAA